MHWRAQVAHAPRFVLWVIQIKVGENFVVREMPPPGEDIRELIEIAVDEGDFVVIPHRKRKVTT